MISFYDFLPRAKPVKHNEYPPQVIRMGGTMKISGSSAAASRCKGTTSLLTSSEEVSFLQATRQMV
jgi:hypothetical protein